MPRETFEEALDELLDKYGDEDPEELIIALQERIAILHNRAERGANDDDD